MASVSHEHVVLEEHYHLDAKSKRNLFIFLGIGIALFVLGIFLLATDTGEGHGHEGAGHAVESHAAAPDHGAVSHKEEVSSSEAHGAESHEEVKASSEEVAHGEGHHFHWITRVWANLWLNGIFFTGLSIIGLFFVSFNYVAFAGWSVVIKRVPEAFPAFLPFTFVVLLVVFFLGGHDLFHWTHTSLYQAGEHFDKILDSKKGFFFWPVTDPASIGIPYFFLGRMVLFFGLWMWIYSLIRKQSKLEDIHGGESYFHKSTALGATFLLVFGVSSVISAWDWVMSIDPHWFSTMFGWYVFASWFVSGMATITLTVVLLKENGYLKLVNANHLHDLGKFMFGFSIFWTYIWFSQFILIFYANISEETVYFITRLYGYDGKYLPLFILNLFLNFFFPFIALMTREAKRQLITLKIVSIVIIIGHYLDFYMMIMPGTLKEHSGFGPLEFGTILIFATSFILVIANALSKASLVAKNHPMLEESIHHNI